MSVTGSVENPRVPCTSLTTVVARYSAYAASHSASASGVGSGSAVATCASHHARTRSSALSGATAAVVPSGSFTHSRGTRSIRKNP